MLPHASGVSSTLSFATLICTKSPPPTGPRDRPLPRSAPRLRASTRPRGHHDPLSNPRPAASSPARPDGVGEEVPLHGGVVPVPASSLALLACNIERLRLR